MENENNDFGNDELIKVEALTIQKMFSIMFITSIGFAFLLGVTAGIYVYVLASGAMTFKDFVFLCAAFLITTTGMCFSIIKVGKYGTLLGGIREKGAK